MTLRNTGPVKHMGSRLGGKEDWTRAVREWKEGLQTAYQEGAYQAGPGLKAGHVASQGVLASRPPLVVRVGRHPQLLGGKGAAASVLVGWVRVHRGSGRRSQLEAHGHACTDIPAL